MGEKTVTDVDSSFWRKSLGGVVAVCAALSVSAVQAQAPAEQQAQAPAEQDDGYTPRGARLGGFLLFPKLVVEETYNDNIFKANRNAKDDFITQISPSLNLRSDWNRHSLIFDAKTDIGRYADSSADDYEDFDLRVRGRADATRALRFFGDLRHRLLHEERGGDDVASDAAAPVEYDRTNGEARVEYKPNRFGVRVGGTVDRYDYDDNRTIGGATTNNDDRDRFEWTTTLRAGYEIQDGYEAYVRARYNEKDYRSAVDDSGFNRDSDGYNLQAGLAVDLTRLVRADVALGWMSQSYADAQLKDVSGWSADTRISWDVTTLTTLRFLANRAINETTTADVSGTLVTNVGIGVDHEFLRNLTAKADLRYSTTDYQGDPAKREDDKLTFSAGVDYKLNRNFFGGVKYTYEDRDSNIDTNDYSNNIVKLSLGAQF